MSGFTKSSTSQTLKAGRAVCTLNRIGGLQYSFYVHEQQWSNRSSRYLPICVLNGRWRAQRQARGEV